MRRSRRIGWTGPVLFALSLGIPAAAATRSSERITAEEHVRSTVPAWPNPYLAFLPPGARPDWDYWRARLGLEAAYRRDLLRSAGAEATAGIEIVEAEPPDVLGANDLPFLAEPLSVGTRPGQESRAIVRGALAPIATEGGAAREPDGSIPTALPVPLPEGSIVGLSGRIGDGPHGSGGGSTGDFDSFALELAAGDEITVQVVTPEPLGDLNPVVGLYDEDGVLVFLNDDVPLSGFLTTFDSYLRRLVDRTGTYTVIVGGFTPGTGGLDFAWLRNPFDAASGPGAGSEGEYRLLLARSPAPGPDRDLFSVDLRAGDVVGAAVAGGATQVSLLDAAGRELVGSPGVDVTGVYGAGSPLPGGGRAAFGWVVDAPGRYHVAVSSPLFYGVPEYTLELAVARPALEAGTGSQILFLDFDGASVDTSVFGFPFGTRSLSPLASFLPRWGIPASEEPALVREIVERVEGILRNDLASSGGNGFFPGDGTIGHFDLEILNSLDDPDPWGAPRVSRVVVGGTVEELGATTIGLAESVDVGNFATEETAVVLLDLLSGPADDPSSLRGIPRERPLRDVVVRSLANLVSHEAGHLFADFHTERDDGPPTIMDRGGRLDILLGLGPDGVFGSPDDLEVRLLPDRYAPIEGFSGIEDEPSAVAFALPRGGEAARLAVLPGTLDLGAVAPGGRGELGVSVSNAGSGFLEVRVSVSGPGFDVDAPPGPRSLAPGDVWPLTVGFEPTGSFAAEGSLTVDGGVAGVLDVALRGRGGVPHGALGDTNLDFGILDYGPVSISATRETVLRSFGDAPLTVYQAALTGARPEAFELIEAPSEVEPGETGVVILRFAPGGMVGPASARLLLLTDDPESPRLEIDLRGRAEGPDFDLSPAEAPYHYGAVRVGNRSRRDWKVINRGSRDLHLAGATLAGPDASEFSIESGEEGPQVLGPGAVGEVTVWFEPVVAGSEKRARVVFESDDPDSPRFERELLGAGVVPDLVPSPSGVVFPVTAVGESVVASVELRNEGEAALRIESVALDGPDAAQFAVVRASVPTRLSPGGSIRVDLGYTPSRPGSASASLLVESDDPESPTLAVPLLGMTEGAVPEIPALEGLGAAAFVLLLIGAATRLLRAT